MARKNTMKNDNNSITFNTKNKSVMADVVQDNIKEKVNAVREVVQGRSNNEIILVLQYYDYDVEKAIQAYLEDGAKLALTEWQYSGTKPVKKKRNKKKPAAEQKDAPMSPESNLSESGSTTSFMVNGDAREPVVNGVLENHIDRDVLKIDNNNKLLSNGPTSVSSLPSAPPSVKDSHPPVVNNNTNSVIYPSPPEVAAVAAESYGAKEKSPSPQPQRQQHHGKPRTHSGSHSSHHDSRVRTASTSSVGDGAPGKKHTPAHHGLERSSKDLHRQTVSLERLRLVFNEEVDKTYKRIKSVFDELRNCLMVREAVIMKEMNTVRDTGRDVFIMRQGLAADLKVKIDRAEKMNETELAELRNEIKHFVSERKMDEDLGRNTRFFYDSDLLNREIMKFGEVVPVKCLYSQRRGSMSSGVSDDHPLPGQVVNSNHVSVEKERIQHSGPTKGGNQVTSIAQPLPSEGDMKETLPHLNPSEAHEMAELQKRLKHSLTLEGIKVETYQDRPESSPVITITETIEEPPPKSSGSNRRNNRNRRRPNDRDWRDRGPRGGDDNRVSTFSQNSSGERVILIGKSTRPQSGPARSSRGGGDRGRGRGGYSGRGRGGNPNPGPRTDQGPGQPGNTQASNDRSGATQEKSPKADRPRREGSGSPRKGRGGGGGGYRGRGRGSPPVNKSSVTDNVVNN